MVTASGIGVGSVAVKIRDILAIYATEKKLSPRYLDCLRRSVNRLNGSGITKVCQLKSEDINPFLSSLEGSETTRHNIRREVLTLWRFAYEKGWTQRWPARIPKIVARQAPPEAWSLETLRLMMERAREDTTHIGGVTLLRRCDILPPWISIGYSTALRFEDIHNLRVDELRNGCVSLVARKTGKPLARRLEKQALVMVDWLIKEGDGKTVFKWALTRRRAFVTWRSFLDDHGIKGSSKYLRRSAATYLEKNKAGSASEYLQHSDPRLVKKHYLDSTLFGTPEAPPNLWDGLDFRPMR